MLRIPLPPRPLLALLCVLAAAVGLARPARAEEAIVLDNGTVLRGNVVREDEHTILFKLAGVGTDNRLTIERRHVTQRFVTVEREKWAALTKRSVPGQEPLPAPVDLSSAVATPLVHPAKPPPLPAEEPDVREESFFVRTARRGMLAFPSDSSSRLLLATLGMVLLLCLVALGGKMADVRGMTLGKSTGLGMLLGALITVNCVFAESLLRADHAIVFLPLELLAWVSCAAMMLRCGFGRAFTLLAFVLFSGTLVSFSAAAMLVLA